MYTAWIHPFAFIYLQSNEGDGINIDDKCIFSWTSLFDFIVHELNNHLTSAQKKTKKKTHRIETQMHVVYRNRAMESFVKVYRSELFTLTCEWNERRVREDVQGVINDGRCLLLYCECKLSKFSLLILFVSWSFLSLLRMWRYIFI